MAKYTLINPKDKTDFFERSSREEIRALQTKHPTWIRCTMPEQYAKVPKAKANQ